MTRSTCLAVAWLACALLVPAALNAAKPDAKDAAANAEVLRALRAEVAGDVDRRAALRETLRDSNAIPAARWQAGYVRDGDAWRSFDEPLAANRREKLEEHAKRRAATPANANDQLQLANWCRKAGLVDQEQAHLQQVLTLDPQGDHRDVLQRLGYRQVFGQWLSRSQLAEWQESNKQAQASLKRWGPSLEKIAKQLEGARRQRMAGEDALKRIDDVSAIPAIEYTLAGRDEPSALAAVSALDRIPGYEATIALARQGMFSKWPSVRRAAATALKARRLEDFAPALVGLMSTIRSEINVYDEGLDLLEHPASMRLFYSFVIARETDDQFQVKALNFIDFSRDDLLPRTVYPRFQPETATLLARGYNDAALRMQDILRANERTADELKERAEDVNRRAADVLVTVSGRPFTAEPRDWQAWWQQVSDVQAVGNKPVNVVSETTTFGNPAPVTVARASCFAAGTLVRTETGLVPIEEIRVGDRVLSKDVETGELAYKPVLNTTLRPPKELMTLRLGDESIVCTGGHQFWKSGTGWVKARDLAPDTLVHTTTGNTQVSSTEKAATDQTFNLVVADFHTYFVGKTGLLCQDVLPPHSTNKIVPGLDPAQAAANRK